MKYGPQAGWLRCSSRWRVEVEAVADPAYGRETVATPPFPPELALEVGDEIIHRSPIDDYVVSPDFLQDFVAREGFLGMVEHKHEQVELGAGEVDCGAIAVGHGFGSAEELAGADARIEELCELPATVAALLSGGPPEETKEIGD